MIYHQGRDRKREYVCIYVYTILIYVTIVSLLNNCPPFLYQFYFKIIRYQKYFIFSVIFYKSHDLSLSSHLYQTVINIDNSVVLCTTEIISVDFEQIGHKQQSFDTYSCTALKQLGNIGDSFAQKRRLSGNLPSEL